MKVPLTALMLAVTALAAAVLGPRMLATAGFEPARLGSKTACRSYGGIPRGWPQRARAGMAYVSAGSYVPGSTGGYPDERPNGRVDVRPFWIDETEVTNAQFRAFVGATGFVTQAEVQGGASVFVAPEPGTAVEHAHDWWRWVAGANWRHPDGPSSDAAPAAPVAQVTLEDALAYARWLGHDLPTEVEWEFAARGGLDGAPFDGAPVNEAGEPSANYWQGQFPEDDQAADGFRGRAPVGCFASNPLGLYDVIGNAWEWTADAYDAPRPRPSGCHTAWTGDDAGAKRARTMVIKGGSFLCAANFCVRYRATARHAHESDMPTAHVGFRTVSRAGPP